MKTLIVYFHLISACLAIGTLIIQDYKFLMLRSEKLKAEDLLGLENTAKVMTFTLQLLWLSGVALVIHGYINNPEQYLLNEKLWAKVIVVVLLTLNGVVLHFYSFKVLKEGTILLSLPTVKQVILILTGVTSTVSWMFAVYLGIARPWNYSKALSDIMVIYSVLWLVPFIFGNLFFKYFQYRLFKEQSHMNPRVC